MSTPRIWTQNNVLSFFRQFGVDCLYYQARLSPELRYGVTKLSANALYGYKYATPSTVRLLRTSVNYRIINTEHGRIYEGGARFSIPPIVKVAGVITPVSMFETVFKGDVIVVKNKPVRDYDVLTKGKRDTLFAFDVKKILSVSSVNASGVETLHAYGTDYTLTVDNVAVNATVLVDGTVQINATADMPIASQIAFVWQAGGTAPLDGREYSVEFLCSPNYVIWDELANVRATEDENLPKMVMTVKRAYFANAANTIDGIQTDEAVMGNKEFRDDGE